MLTKSLRKAGILLVLLSNRCLYSPLVKSFHTLIAVRRISPIIMSSSKANDGHNRPLQISKKSLKTSGLTEEEALPVYEISIDLISGVVVRKVLPYIHEFQTFAKGRWLNREIFEILSKEFGSQTPLYWQKAIQHGHLKINNQNVTGKYKMKNGDLMLHRTHRHEPPVFGQVEIVGETDEILAVNKPASMPMHACGAYRFNSLLSILQYDLCKPYASGLHLVHRLDRVTSGLVIVAKSKDTAAVISEEIRNKTTEKVYLARVKGNFPHSQLFELKSLDNIVTTAQLLKEDEVGEDEDEVNDETPKSQQKNSNNHKKRKAETLSPPIPNAKNDTSSLLSPKVAMSFDQLKTYDCIGYQINKKQSNSRAKKSDDEVEYWISCPIGVLSHRDGVHACDPEGKPSISVFRKLGYDPITNTSLMECRPITGRTHQLRLHLQLLGTPIANDPCYGGELFYANPNKKLQALQALADIQQYGIQPLSKIPHLLEEELTLLQHSSSSNTNSSESEISNDEKQSHTPDNRGDEQKSEEESEDTFLQRCCRYCQANQTILALEQYVHCDGIWLHAFRYAGKNWSFATPWPNWAKTFPITNNDNHSDSSSRE